MSELIPMTIGDLSRRMRNLVGYKGGRLTIIDLVGKQVYPKGGFVLMWRAQCTCGNKVTVNGLHFIGGNIASCGCLLQERSALSKKMFRTNKGAAKNHALPIPLKLEDLVTCKTSWVDFTGKRFGSLKVRRLLGGTLYMSPAGPGKNGKVLTPRKHVVTMYECKCSCGCLVTRSSSYLYAKESTLCCQKCSRLPKSKRGKKHVPKI